MSARLLAHAKADDPQEQERSLVIERVLITGAAGFIGSHLADRCIDQGWDVDGVDAFTDYYDESVKRRNIDAALDRGLRLIEGDLIDVDLAALLEGVDAVFHLAAQPGVRTSWDAFELYSRRNVDATQRLLHAAVDVPLQRFVVASSSSVYGDAETMPTAEEATPRPISPYGMTKVATEHLARIYLRNFGVPTVCLRYFTVYGPRQRPDMAFNRLIACALSEREFQIYGDGEQTRDFTFVADAVSATLAAGLRGRPGSVYNIGGSAVRSMNSVLETLEAMLGRPVDRGYRPSQAGDARNTTADIRRAREELGYAPAANFEDGLAAQLEWQQAELTEFGLVRSATPPSG